MVEMQETANILHCATSRSLVILDEIGRGTATFDGLSLAWAVAEHLASNPKARPKTIFATHYHELTDLADALPGVANFHVVVREWKDDIVFLRKVVPGPLGPQLRHPGRAAGRAAGRGRRARARDPERPRARRAVARRPAVAERRRRPQPAAARTVPGAAGRRRSGARAPARARRQPAHAAAGALAARRTEGRGGRMTRAPWRAAAVARARRAGRSLSPRGCAQPRPTRQRRSSSAMTNSALNLDPRVGTDEASQKVHQLLYNSLVRIDDQLRVVPDLAESLEQPDPLTYVARLRRGVLFHNGRELTAADVVYTFRSFLDPDVPRPHRRVSAARRVDALDPLHGRVHAEGAVRLVPDQPGDGDRAGRVRRRPTRAADRHRALPARRSSWPTIASCSTPFDEHYDGRAEERRPRAEGRPRRHDARPRAAQGHGRPRRQRPRRPTSCGSCGSEGRLQVATAPGTDYAYIGLNLRDPILQRVEVRKAIGYAIDRDAIVKYLRRGFATTAVGIVPPMSWAFERDVFDFRHDPAEARAAARRGRAFRDPDGDGPAAALRADAEDVDVGGVPHAGGGDPARSRARRHRARDPLARNSQTLLERRRRAATSSCTRCSSSASPIPTCCGASITRSRRRRPA